MRDPDATGGDDQLAKEQDVPLARGAQRVDGGAVDGTAQDVDGQHRDVGDRQRRHLDALQQLVLPEHDHGLGRRLARSQRHDREHASVQHEVQEQRRRRVVEVLGVVHEEHPGRAIGVVEDRLGEIAQQVAATLGLAARRGREQRGEGAVRDGRRAPVGTDVRGPVPAPGPDAQALEGEPGLADAGGAGEQHAAGLAVHRRRHLRELGDPPDQRPRRGVHRRRAFLPWNHGPHSREQAGESPGTPVGLSIR